MQALDRYREKWREVPSGAEGRVFGDSILELDDERFLAYWSGMATKRTASVVGGLYPLYRDHFAGRRVLELGGGLGFDGMHYAGHGAQWTFADIVPSNLAAIRRAAKLKGVDVATHQIGDDLSFDALDEFDAIMVIGSIHHVPFDIARREAVEALRHLRVGGRWIELVYPRERWLREGSMPADRWGTRTDGERTPWADGTTPRRSGIGFARPGCGRSSTWSSPGAASAG
jgi:SAM-dependent methyltransferase